MGRDIRIGPKEKRTPKLGRDPLSRKEQANADEHSLADRLRKVDRKAKRQPNSGATPAHKGDVKLSHFIVDLKTTQNNSYIVTVKDLVALTKWADGESKQPAMVIEFKGEKPLGCERAWALLPVSVLEKMLKANQDADL